MPTNEFKPPIFLLDSMSFIFRAYHAMQRQRPMSTRHGVPTAATYVFVNMINKLRRDFSPHYFAAIFDTMTPVFRDERAKAMTSVRKFNIKTQQFEEVAYEGYKANRTEMPADLAQQLPYIRRALEAFHIPIIQYEGFEADDVIGTLAHKAESAGHKVYIVSNDKDMLQLVTQHVLVLNPVKDNLVLDRAAVEQTLGVPPERVIDVMALRGDSIDNIPGAPGIGDKGSVELIQQFGSLEAALNQANEVKRKSYRESLQNNRENILLSKELVTIHCSVPVDLELARMETQEPDVAAARALFNELEFTTLLKELAPAIDAAHAELIIAPTDEDYATFFSIAQQGFSIAVDVTFLEALTEQVSESQAEAVEDEAPMLRNLSLLDAVAIAERTEAVGEREHFVAVSAAGGRALRLSLTSETGARLKSLLEDASVPKTVHDLKATMRALENHGITIANVRDDLMLYSYLINPTHATHRLADVVARFTGSPLSETGERQLPEQAAAIYALVSAMRTDVEAIKAVAVYEMIDLPLVSVLLAMERTGVRIDVSVLAGLAENLNSEMSQVSEQIFEQAGQRFNLNSPKQLGEVLFNKMKLPKPLKYGKGKVVSTAQDVLEELALHHPVPAQVLAHRQLAKLKSNYVDSLPLLADSDGRVHTTFNQVGTATGRLSSTNPNLQNIPIRTEKGREIRAAFIAAPGCVLLSADYSQIELRLMAHFSDDPLLVQAYQAGQDIHTLTASEVFGVPPMSMSKETRNRAKAVNFGIVYGISPFGLAANLNIPQAEARLYIETYFARYAGVRQFIDRLLEETRATQQVRTLFGRVRPIPDIQSRNPNLRGFAERTAVNTPLQGTAADMIKIAMIRIDQKLRTQNLRTKMTLQVHDELLFDVPKEEIEAASALVKQEMENVIRLNVPIVVDIGIGQNWRDLKKA
jgi:DNA polymerase-1